MPGQTYNDKPLYQKLGIKPGMEIAVLRFSEIDFVNGQPFDRSLVADKLYDVILFRADEFPHLRDLRMIKPHVAERGGLWVVYPKGQKHITQNHVMFAGNTDGFVDNKVVRFSDTHTGLRFVRRLK